MQDAHAQELIRARLAFVDPGVPSWAPRRGEPDHLEAVPPAVAKAPSAAVEHPVNAARWQLSRMHILVLAVLAALGVGFAIYSFLGSGPREAQLPVAVTSSVVESPSASPTPTVQLRVHVAGAVATPGVVVLPAGAIVQDALLAAGGLAEEANPADLNLAAPLSDGAQLIVGTKGDPRGEIVGAIAPTNGEITGVVDLNAATMAELDELPGVGPVTAQAIVDWRDEHGPFQAVDELLEISGIGDKTLEKLRPKVRT